MGSKERKIIPLFPGKEEGRIPPWPPVDLDPRHRGDQDLLGWALDRLYELKLRDLRLIRALDRALVDPTQVSPEFQKTLAVFATGDALLTLFIEAIQAGHCRPKEVPALAEVLTPMTEALEQLRMQLLSLLTPEKRQTVLKAEPRVRVSSEDIDLEVIDLGLERILLEGLGLTPKGLGASGSSFWADLPDLLMADVEEGWLKAQNQVPLTIHSQLKACLNKLPAHWVQAMALALGVAERRKKERIQTLSLLLKDPRHLLRIVKKSLQPKEREALQFVLERGGYVSYKTLTRRFGSEAGDGWFWVERNPTSTIGRLRLHGLLTVGRAPFGTRSQQIALIPEDLREPLEAAFAQVGGGRWKDRSETSDPRDPTAP